MLNIFLNQPSSIISFRLVAFYTGQKNKNNNIPATRVNIVTWKIKKKDFGKITYYNCNNKGHYANACPDQPKAKN